MYYLTVSRVLKLVSSELDPYIQKKLAPDLDGLGWINVLKQLDIARGKSIGSWEYKSSDLSMQLRMLTERLGNLGYPFDSQDRNRTCSSYGSVLRLIRNRWAHNDEFHASDALQAVEITYALLAHIGARETAKEITEIRAQLLESIGNSTRGHANPTSSGEPNELTTPDEQPQNSVSNNSSTNAQSTQPGSPSSPSFGYHNECEEWKQIIIGEQSELDSMRSTRTKEMVRSLIEDIVDVEGPVSPDRVAHLVGKAFGFTRLPKARVAQITRQYQGAKIHQDEHGFLWPPSIDLQAWSSFRTLGKRDFLEISPYELSNALVHICGSTDGETASSDMRKSLLKMYGRKRETADVKRHLDIVISTFQSK